ncbi:MAG TPA: NAD(P)/FAD-dependent oxidoreductase, partial [Bacillota bacterium]|nr:NAD(P)/FAD-dependent oxidoreductase [Bacillota bacterium]
HFGISGPVVLSASSHLSAFPVTACIDLKIALDAQTLDRRILRDFSAELNRNFDNSLFALLPQKLITPFIRLTGIDAHKKVNSITKEERAAIVRLLKRLPVEITGKRPMAEGIITSGGVKCSEIDPKTMCSKLVPGLYFAGEVIDVDAYTGGYNLQIAFSTARSAARAIIKSINNI